MNVDRSEMFKVLEPPRGGVERLRERLAEPTGSGIHVSWRAVAAAGVAIALVLVVVTRPPADDESRQESTQASDIYAAPELDRLLGRESEPVELSVSVNGEEASVVQLASSDARIRVYSLRSGARGD